MMGQLIDVGDPRWLEALDRCRHDVYQRPQWVEIHSTLSNARPLGLVVEGDGQIFLCPLEHKALDGGRWDAGSPYGYPGPVCSSSDPGIFATMMRTAADVLTAEGAVTWFIRLHPLLNGTTSGAVGHVVHHGSTVAIDLSKSLDDLWAETRSGHRYDIQRSRKAGIIVEQSRSLEDHAAFARVYKATMDRVQARDFYYFRDEYSQVLEQALGDDMQLWVARSDSEVIAASIFTTCRSTGITQYHLSGTSDDALKLQPSKLILDEARRWAKDAGFRWMHLGGGLGAGDDGLARFKRGFSPIAWPFGTMRAVLDPGEYDRRCDRAGAHLGLDGFFPLYTKG